MQREETRASATSSQRKTRRSRASAPGGKKLVRSAVKQVTADFDLTARMIEAILQMKPMSLQGIDEQNEEAAHWVNVVMNDAGIFRLTKTNTVSLEINHENWMLKVMHPEDLKQEICVYQQLAGKVPMPEHRIVELENGVKLLLRGPVTKKSIGDIVYAHFANDTDDRPEVPDKGDLVQADRIQKNLFEQLYPAIDNLDRIRQFCHEGRIRMPITLDNIDLNGQLYDFGDWNSGPHNIDIALSDFVRCLSMANQQMPETIQKWFPVNHNFKELGWKDKVLAVNNNLLHAPSVATELFIDASTQCTHSYYNPITGYSEIDQEKLERLDDYVSNLYKLQDPGLRYGLQVAAICSRVEPLVLKPVIGQKPRAVFYNEEAYDFFTTYLDDISDVHKYTYFQGNEPADTLTDFMLYDYQGRLFLQPHVLEYLYEQTLEDFGDCRTDRRFTKEDCCPRNSSLGPSTTLLLGVKQKALYEVAPDDIIEQIVNLSATSPLIFTTKVVQKFALTAKARARTIAACSMFSSTLFRALHKPVTAKFVEQAQNPLSNIHHLIGVSKFRGKFDEYFTARHGDLDNWKVFGSDYTKCDRSFPLVLRSMAAAILYELGDWDPNSYHFTNEIHSFMLDFVEMGNGSIYAKPGGTSSGDATTAFANTLYNHAVHLLVQLQTLVTSDVHPKHRALKVAACQAWQTGHFDNYRAMVREYNSKSYKFNFLSDDSFILTDRHDETLPDIYNKRNFSRKLETIIHTTVDENKAWEAQGMLHEFCSSEVLKIDGVLQYIPDRTRLLAALIITGKDVAADLNIVRIAAILCEAAIYHKVDQNFWRTLWAYYQDQCNKFSEKFGCLPVPEQMLVEEFFTDLVDPNGKQATIDIMLGLMEEYGEQVRCTLQAKATVQQKCYCCPNMTISTCTQCPVPYPLCAYCAVVHYRHTTHRVTHLPTCADHHCDENRPEALNFSLENHQFTIKCNEHVQGLQIPVYDQNTEKFQLPLSNYAIKYKEAPVDALNATIETFANETLFQWNTDHTPEYNKIKMLHDSHLNEQYSESQEQIFEYEVLDVNSNKIRIKGATYGFTTYASILNEKNQQKLTCTVDPLGGDQFRLTFVDDSKRYRHFGRIQRTTRCQTIIRAESFDVLRDAEFVLGPPGTGKTTLFIEQYFTKANQYNQVVYAAPTHKLVQDMDQALKGRNDVSILKAKLNNREYHAVVNDNTKPILLSTTNTIQPRSGCILLIDEVSLLSPRQLLDAVVRSRAAKIIIVGDPFQLSPVTPVSNFRWDYEQFYLRHLTKIHNQRHLDTCYRCPDQIFNVFAGAYLKAGITIKPARLGGVVNWKTIPNTMLSQMKTTLEEVAKEKPTIILCNYKEAVIEGMKLGLNICTIDSAQGLTSDHVAVVIFGSTGFSRVLNRLIVATSRATQRLDIYCTTIVQRVFEEQLMGQKVELEAKLTKPCMLERITLEETARNLSAVSVTDLEFYHVKPNDRTMKNFLGLGEISNQTAWLFKTYLRPRYNRDQEYFEPEDHQIVVSKQWRYMLQHLPDRTTSELYLDIMLRKINDSADLENHGLIFVTFNGTNDLDALADITLGKAKCHKCGKEARFESEAGPVCQVHIDEGGQLTHLRGASYFNIQSSTNLETTHAQVCGRYHGHAHASNVDTVLTSCLLAHLVEPKASNEPVYDDGFQKIEFSVNDKNNRCYGGKLFYEKNQKLHVIEATRPKIAYRQVDQIEHTDEYVNIPRGYEGKTCHPVSPLHICTACLKHYQQFEAAVKKRTSKGWYPRATKVNLNLTQAEKQLKLSAEIIQKNHETFVYFSRPGELGTSTKFYHSLDQTIKRVTRQTAMRLPSCEVIFGLGINCSVNCSHAAVEVKDANEVRPWDIPLVPNVPIKHEGVQYVVQTQRNDDQDDTKSFVIGLDEIPFTNINGNKTYSLQKYQNNQKVELKPTLYSTGRLYTQQDFLFNGEEQTTNAHIELGEYSKNKFTIGGMHLYPKAFKGNSQQRFDHIGMTPLWKGTVVAEQGSKINNSIIDVHSGKFIRWVEELIKEDTVSLKTTIRIDHQEVPIMIWADQKQLQTAYLQKASHSNGRRDVPVYDEAVTHVRTKNEHYIRHQAVICPYSSVDELMHAEIPVRKYWGEHEGHTQNVSKYVQLCHVINDHCPIPIKAQVLHIGAAPGEGKHYGISVGSVVFQHVFSQHNIELDNADLLPINTCNGRHQVIECSEEHGPQKKYHLIVADIWAPVEEGQEYRDNYELLKTYINHNLKLGGSIVFKTTRRNTVTKLTGLKNCFGSFHMITPKSTIGGSEVWLVFASKHQNVDEDVDDHFHVLHHLFHHRTKQLAVPRPSQLDIGTKVKIAQVFVVLDFMKSQITQAMWKSGRFIEQ
ncbi:replicase 1b [Shingleback nidovirus 1]|uniref:Replicase polyprotein 1ab n=1 Tax=Shingleback nidovirus 1 TaxID=1912590 RepID=A0A1I9RYV8_9NIDO|nr:replicase 1b [Shingleback nidovirus 1]AOZ57153.1 replicase 1b [Shingleback nidovirus 1]